MDQNFIFGCMTEDFGIADLIFLKTNLFIISNVEKMNCYVVMREGYLS